MSSAHDRVLALRLVLATMTASDDAYEDILAELDPDACRRALDALVFMVVAMFSMLAEQYQEGDAETIRVVEKEIAARLDDLDGEPQ